VMLFALDRHLKDKGQEYSILKDKRFDSCRKVLNGKAIELREKGMGKRKNKSDLLNSEEEKLWQLKVLGGNNPTSLNYNMFYPLLVNNLVQGDVKNISNFESKISSLIWNTLHVEWVEGMTKTGQGGSSKTERRLTQLEDVCTCQVLELLSVNSLKS